MRSEFFIFLMCCLQFFLYCELQVFGTILEKCGLQCEGATAVEPMKLNAHKKPTAMTMSQQVRHRRFFLCRIHQRGRLFASLIYENADVYVKLWCYSFEPRYITVYSWVAKTAVHKEPSEWIITFIYCIRQRNQSQSLFDELLSTETHDDTFQWSQTKYPSISHSFMYKVILIVGCPNSVMVHYYELWDIIISIPFLKAGRAYPLLKEV